MTGPALLWLRRDLRLADHPALLAAADAGTEVLPVFVLDDVLRGPAGAPRLAFLYQALADLHERTDGALQILAGDPATVIPRAARAAGADTVHVSADFGPYGARRDAAVRRALEDDGRSLVATGSPYAVSPGRIRKADGSPYRVYTPFRRAWQAHGWRAPAARPRRPPWATGDPLPGHRRVPAPPAVPGVTLPTATESAATRAWRRFADERLDAYADARDRPATAGTSRLSVYLKYGLLHPRTLLADLAERPGPGADTFRGELAWRDFYADVLADRPDSAREWWNPAFAAMRHDTGRAADARFDAWAQGRTGYPIVDAGMRQLLGEAWMHNRVRMIVASFLVKDLHLPWQRGARHFLQHLVDGDLASNNHGWQWVAGSGTDAAPYFRVFNPITQGEKFDPDGDYVRRWVPELTGVAGRAVHQPWSGAGGLPDGYPERIVDHAAERAEALARYQELRDRG